MKRPFSLDQDHVVLPKGTRVVLKNAVPSQSGYLCKAGTIAQITEVNHPSYTLTTPSGRHTIQCQRQHLVIQRQKVAQLAERRTWTWKRLEPHIVLAVVVGSKAWNLATPTSDTDIKGAFLLPFSDQSGLYETPDEIQQPGSDAQYWEVEKFIRQALRADANTLETLWSPEVLHQTDVGAMLREHRSIFVSKLIYRAFGRYAISQFDKIQQKLDHARLEERLLDVVRQDRDIERQALLSKIAEDTQLCPNPKAAKQTLERLSNSLFDRGLTERRDIEGALIWLRAQDNSTLEERSEYRPKNAYNLLRLLHSGLQWLRDGEPLIAIEPDRPDGLRERLMAVKRSEVPIAEVLEEAHDLAHRFEQAWEQSTLPEDPDFDAADALLRHCRSSAARHHVRLSWRKPPQHAPEPPVLRQPRFDIPTDALRAFLIERYSDVDTVVCSITGSHNFGFPSPDSDFDIKGLHIAPAQQLLGLDAPVETAKFLDFVDGLEIDYTSNESAKAIKLLLSGNGNMIERILSPYQILPIPGQSPLADQRLTELRHLAIASVNTRFARHYRGFFQGTMREYKRDPTIKTLLYLYRVGLTGLHMMRTGKVVPDLALLLEQMDHPLAAPLIAMKTSGHEKMSSDQLENTLETEILADLANIHDALEVAVDQSHLPAEAPNRDACIDWLERWRTTAVT